MAFAPERDAKRYTSGLSLMTNKLGLAVMAGVLFLPLTGCYRTTRAVQKTHPPPQVFTVSLDHLVKDTDSRYDAIKTMNASVEISATTGGGKEGQITETTGFTGYILLRKPGDLRVLLFAPFAHIRALDMVTDGTTFKMAIPPRNRFITGSNVLTKPSKNALENLRPGVFYDSLLIQGLQKGQVVSVTADDRVYQPDPLKKYFVQEPTCELSFHQPVENSVELKTLRTVHLGRSTLLPFQQDIYDADGQLDTQATYDNYQKFGDVEFPSKIVIRRPKDQLSLTLTITKMTVNQALGDDQFELKIPDNVKVEKLP